MAIRPFVDTLSAIRFGELHEELSNKLNQLVIQCDKTGKSGTLTLQLKLKPGKAGQVEVIDEVKIKLPEHERGSTIMFGSPEGNLQRTDPRQLPLNLREVEKPQLPPKEISA